ncbi:MAG TPA: hypothetical protein VK571_08080 [Gemmatimonadaceae bacterium]|jgi:hypothetical protein|nr:hypothetical protein [Gemmatimonadaceae bacterium]
MSKRRIAFAGAALTLALAACTKDEPDNRAALTQREKDSILGASTIPGAKAVKKTLTVADSVAARQQRMIDTAQ